MNDQFGAIVTARMGSSRFPGKSMVNICGKPSLQWLIERVLSSKNIDELIIATTIAEKDLPIVELAKKLGVLCIQGPVEDVLTRVYEASLSLKSDRLIYLTGDCPLTDPGIIDYMIDIYRSKNEDYLKNFQWGPDAKKECGFPNGLDVEVFSKEILNSVHEKATDPWLREHVTEPMYTWKEFSHFTVEAPEKWRRPHYRICIDTKEDYQLVNTIFEELIAQKVGISAESAITYLDDNPDLLKINQTTSQAKYTACIIGLGNIGFLYDLDPKLDGIQTHASAYRRWSSTRLVSGSDLDESRCKLFKNHYQLENVYSNYHDMIENEKPDIVSVCTPPELQYQIISSLLKTDIKAIWCEKPFGLEQRQWIDISKKLEEKKVQLFVNYWMRFTPLFSNLKAYLGEGNLGKIWGGTYIYSGGGYNSGTHALDILNYLFGKPLKFDATYKRKLKSGDHGIGTNLHFKDDVVFNLFPGNKEKHFTTEIDILGEKGRIRISDHKPFVEYFESKPSEIESGVNELVKMPQLPFDGSKSDIQLNVIQNITHSLDGNSQALCTGDDGLWASQYMDELKKSLGEN
ncbi:MAG: Gfo/Idh/MocA family oxidoreductase [Bacteriovoracaceae bacterium]|jgi:spore coat polysaccharide biosynthesis protein SpsF|nr:Gfo/Idh/MocA family oxidoreductase [Bacteriovoracaceae bacterium]